MKPPFGTGAFESPKDYRTFAYAPSGAPQKGGTKYLPEDAKHQHKIGTCTSSEMTQLAGKAIGMVFSDDFQYLAQKREYDSKEPIGWQEGSSDFNALKVAKNIGLLPASEWTHTTTADKMGSYNKYIKKLQAITDEEYARLCKIAAQYKISAYARLPDLSLGTVETAINESKAGILVRFNIDHHWWTNAKGESSWAKEDLEPLQPPTGEISGHAGILCNFDGGSVRDANCWGPDWCDGGTGYFLYSQYQPSEAWMVYFDEVPDHVIEQLKKRVTLLGKLADALQLLINLKRKFI